MVARIDLVPVGVVEEDLRLALRHDVDRVGRIALTDDHLAGSELHHLLGVGDQLQPGRRQSGEEGDLPEGLDVLLEWLHVSLLP